MQYNNNFNLFLSLTYPQSTYKKRFGAEANLVFL